MKKLISVLIAIMMMSTTVLADTADGLRELLTKQTQLKSFTSKTVLDIDVNEPLKILDYIPEDEYSNIDYALMLNDMADAEITVNCAYNVSDDYKKMQMAMDCEFDIPVHINDSFKLDAWAKIGIWYNYDVTDAENPVFEIIVRTPLDPSYVVGDLAKEYKTDLTSLMNADTVKNTAEAMADAIIKNASITKTSKGYTVKFNNEGFGGLINDWMNIVGEYMAEAEKEELESAIQELGNVFSGVSLLGKNGMTLSVTKNAKGELVACTKEMHLDFNVCDIIESMGLSAEGIEHDDAQLDLTLRAATEISGINSTKVTLPQLTPENTVPMFDGHSDVYYTADNPPLFRNDKIYYPVDEAIEFTGIDAQISGNKVTLGESVFEGDIITLEGNIYATKDVLDFIGITYSGVRYDTVEERFVCDFEYYPIEPDSTEEPDDAGYEPEHENSTVHTVIEFDIERVVYSYNDIAYMPVYEFLSGLYDGEFSYGYKSLTYTATTENEFGIKTVSVRDGDRFVTVDGVKFDVEAPVKEVNGILNIPISFADTCGYDGYVQTTYYTDGNAYTSYFFKQKEESETIEEVYEDFYLDVWVFSDRLPHIENGEVCVPVYDLLLGMYDGEFSFTENGLEYVANGENDYGIKKVTVTVGDSFVTVDDKKIDLENKVVSVDDVIRIPIAFTEALGFTIDSIWVYDYGTSYSFSMLNPKYAEK